MYFKSAFYLLFFFVSCSFYAQKAKIPSQIRSIYFQHWQGGQEQSGGGTNFFVELKKPFPCTINLKKVYFKKSEAVFEQKNDSLWIAYFRYLPNQRNENSDGEVFMVNQNPAKIDYKLNPNQVVLEFYINNRVHRIWVSNVKEIKSLEYPTAPPQNK